MCTDLYIFMIGIFGGTFDPIHYGHLRPAQEIKQALSLEKLFLVPASVPPNRPAPVASTAQRLHMVQLATDEFPELVVDDCEIQRDGPSYTVDTLHYFRQRFPREPLCLLLGADAFASLQSWHQWQALPTLAHIVVMLRPHHGDAPPTLPAWSKAHQIHNIDELAASVSGKVYIHKVSPQDISATAIRQAIVAQNNISTLLPRLVQQYIDKHHLYR